MSNPARRFQFADDNDDNLLKFNNIPDCFK